MKLQAIFDLAVKMGIESDLRGSSAVKKQLEQNRKEYAELKGIEKEKFDTEILNNPYSDSRLFYGNPNKEIKRVLAGIDTDAPEIILADRIGGIDAVIGHHPVGKALAELDEVMHLQAQVMAKLGVPINIAEGVMRERISEVSRRLHGGNHNRPVDAARLLDIPLMIIHTVCDNMSANFMQKLIDRSRPVRVKEIFDLLYTIPEYMEAVRQGTRPELFAGSMNNSAGKIAVTEFTGGTNGSKMIYERLAHAGIGTILSMHASDEHRAEAQKNHINLVVAGHMSSDSLGMNIFLDQLEKRGVEIVPVSGLIRVSRNTKSARPAGRTRPKAKNRHKR